jgi:hypothetical protein
MRLKPVVLTLEILFEMAAMAAEFAARPDTPASIALLIDITYS